MVVSTEHLLGDCRTSKRTSFCRITLIDFCSLFLPDQALEHPILALELPQDVLRPPMRVPEQHPGSPCKNSGCGSSANSLARNQHIAAVRGRHPSLGGFRSIW